MRNDKIVNRQKVIMSWVLFWVFVGVFLATAVMTLLSIFYGVGVLSSEHESTLVRIFVFEVGAAISYLFYWLFK